jgi:hypothetical protein
MTQDEIDKIDGLAAEALNGDLAAVRRFEREIGPQEVLDLLAEHQDMEFALRRIALGVDGRQKSGLLVGEASGLPRQSRCDWELAQDVLKRLGRS